MTQITYFVERLITDILLKHSCELESSTDYCGYIVIEELNPNNSNRSVLYPIQSLPENLPEGMNEEETHYNCLKEISLVLKENNCIIKAEDDGFYLEPVSKNYKPSIIFNSPFKHYTFLKNGQFEEYKKEKKRIS